MSGWVLRGYAPGALSSLTGKKASATITPGDGVVIRTVKFVDEDAVAFFQALQVGDEVQVR